MSENHEMASHGKVGCHFLKKRKSIMEKKEQEAEEEMKKIIIFTFADMKYHDLLEEIKQKEKKKKS